jgi:hypothetical protein
MKLNEDVQINTVRACLEIAPWSIQIKSANCCLLFSISSLQFRQNLSAKLYVLDLIADFIRTMEQKNLEVNDKSRSAQR